MIYKAKVEEDSNGNLILIFPDELMEEMGWEVGDDLEWNVVNGEVEIFNLKKLDKPEKLPYIGSIE
jgi:bifunctional DNA-binding transcriptional regulator/antitoxin component of YhaV-PrlF toxin-antitoxin module